MQRSAEKKIWSYDTVSEFFFLLLFLPSHKKLRFSSLSGSGSDYDVVVVVVVLFFFLKKLRSFACFPK